MNYFVFQVSYQKSKDSIRKADTVFNDLVVRNHIWGFSPKANNRRAIHSGDKVLFYLTGAGNQYFAGSATLQSGAREETLGNDSDLFMDNNMMRIELDEIVVFDEPIYRKDVKDLGWHPNMGSSSRISEEDFFRVWAQRK